MDGGEAVVVVWCGGYATRARVRGSVKGHQQRTQLTGSLVTATMFGSAERSIAELAFVLLLGREGGGLACRSRGRGGSHGGGHGACRVVVDGLGTCGRCSDVSCKSPLLVPQTDVEIVCLASVGVWFKVCLGTAT